MQRAGQPIGQGQQRGVNPMMQMMMQQMMQARQRGLYASGGSGMGASRYTRGLAPAMMPQRPQFQPVQQMPRPSMFAPPPQAAGPMPGAPVPGAGAGAVAAPGVPAQPGQLFNNAGGNGSMSPLELAPNAAQTDPYRYADFVWQAQNSH